MFERSGIKVLVLFLAFILPASFGAAAETKSERGTGTKSERGGKLEGRDANFIKEAGEAGMAEVQLGKLAQQKASSEQVKEFGRRMEQDHSKANEALKKLAADKGVELPNELKGKHKSAVDKLSKLSAEEFDREFMRTMIQDHKQVVEKFQRESEKAKDPEVKKFASEQLPTLKKHLELAQTTGDQVGAKGKERTGRKAGKAEEKRSSKTDS